MKLEASRVVRRICFGLPFVVLTGALLWLAVEHGTLRLWDVVVHEGGQRTFGETALYFDHFLREIPIVLAYVLFLLGSSGRVVAPAATDTWWYPRVAWLTLAAAAALVSGSLAATVWADGWRSAFLDVAQFRTRDDLIGFGTHWRYHWLSSLWFGAAAGFAPWASERLTGTCLLRPHRGWTLGAWAWFALMTVVFGLSSDVFVDPRFTGHQAREIMTHAPVTFLAGVGVLVALGGGQGSGRVSRRATTSGWVVAGLALVVAAVPLYLAGVGLTSGVMEHGQADQGLVAMVAGHYLEHTLDYLLAFLLLLSGLSFVNLKTAPHQKETPPRGKAGHHAHY